MSTIAAVILAAGQGTRMRSAIPKVLHRLAGRPMVQYVIDAARGAGIDRQVVVLGHAADEVGRVLGPSIETVVQPVQRGTADAVLCAAAALEGAPDLTDIVIAYGDCPLLTSTVFANLVDQRRATGATIALVVSPTDDPQGYGRVVRRDDGSVRAIVEEAAASESERAIREINAGVYCVEASWLWEALRRVRPSASGEYYLTDIVGLAVESGRLVQSIEQSLAVTAGVNDRVQLSLAESIIRDQIRRRLMLAGVTMVDPSAVYVDDGVSIGGDTVVYPGTWLEGETTIGSGCTVGPSSRISDSTIGDHVTIEMSVVERSKVASGTRIGPFSHLRPGARIGENVELGNFAEVKNSSVGAGTKMHHMSYLGDADVGQRVNIGAGTITCNFDAESGTKNRTVIGDDASLGSDTMLVSPVTLGSRAMTGAGAVVNRDVDADTLVVGVPARALRRRKPPSA